MEIKPEDVECKVYPLEPIQGMGVHNMGSGFQVLHKPTGIGIICTSERSQHANKEKAFQILEEILNGRGSEEEKG